VNKLDLLVEASVYLLNNCEEAKETRQYLNGRIPKNIQEEYFFGYLPPNSNLNLLTDIFTTSFLEEISIIYKKTIAGAVANCGFFNSHNLIFPFKNHNNETVALIARTLLSSEKQKELEIGRYKYSANYDKELYTFGLNKSKFNY
jgi:DNA primase